MKRTRQRQAPRHMTDAPRGPIVQPQAIRRKSAARRRVRFLGQSMRQDTLNHRFYLRIVACHGGNLVGHGRSETNARQCRCQQKHAQASLRSGAIEDGGPVEVRMRPDESCENARPFGACHRSLPTSTS